ncbi:hypothetical protein [Sphingomonas baiyangensis]|uniref:DUF1440 domain-containing protein n=1 Tax=Sphingomonas baiyangensis TaxID=2572576 RepID=A0A4U1L451_9SPHN|nr:hypothetical protein [Sphingomonas baiyangensis]TKD51697.1 hypothetical protein FBR43_13735 [Sphingomonas baiyangensis]
MEARKAAMIGGVVAGIVTTAAMWAGRKSGVLGKTLDRDSVDWIDKNTGARAVIGDTGTSLVEFGNHLAASAAFGAAYAELRERAPAMSPIALGTLYGTGLYGVNIAGIAPLLGITEGEIEAGPRKASERWALHVLQAVVTAVVAERLTRERRD